MPQALSIGGSRRLSPNPQHRQRGVKLRRDIASLLLCVAMLTPIVEQIMPGSSIYDVTIVINAGFIVIALMLNGFHLSPVALRIAAPLILLCILGLLSAAEGANIYDIIKDVWYVLNPCVAIVTGFTLGYMIRDFRRLILCTFFVSFIFAAYHIGQFLLNPSVINESLRSMRQDAGLGEFTSALCLGILFAFVWNKIPWRYVSRAACWVILPFCFASQVLGLSRIWWVCLMVICFSAMGFLHFRRIHMWVPPLVVAALLGLVIPIAVPIGTLDQATARFEVQNKTSGTESGSPAARFFQKLANSLHEITPTDFTNMTEINENWRGYEAYRGMHYFRSGDWNQMLFGHGFGALTDLGILIRLRDSIFRVIPWFHNGFVYLLIKTGILGVAIYLSFVFLLIRYGLQGYNNPDRVTACLSRLLVGSSLSLMLATAVFAGPFNRSRFVSALIFIGAALAVQRGLLAREKLLRRINPSYQVGGAAMRPSPLALRAQLAPPDSHPAA